MAGQGLINWRGLAALRTAAAVFCIALGGSLLTGCQVNPATGEQVFTGLSSTSEEIGLGRQYHPKITKEFGGAYKYRDLGKYVASLGALLARTVERRDLTYTFTLLNSDVVNAFAVPGGYIYITRGLMALADNEAELAGVLAHELGHITALHHARRQGQGLLASVLVTGAAALGGQSAGQAGQLAAVGFLQSHSRENEREADRLGIRYMSRAGFDPRAMTSFLNKLRDHSRLQSVLRGESPDKVDQFNYLATHPAPAERVSLAGALAAKTPVRNPMLARDIYLRKIDGMLYGDDPEQGFIQGRVFAHPKQKFRFEVPPEFNLFNSSQAVIAFGPQKSRIIFDMARKPSDGPLSYYLQSVWAKGRRLANVENITINGLKAATGTTELRTSDGVMDVRLLAIRRDLQTIYRFMFATPPSQSARLATGLQRTTYSFRLLTDHEAQALRPMNLKVRTVRRGDSVASLARHMPYPAQQIERFRVLNGLGKNDRLRSGQKVKIVTN